jgi:hypothetical protein
VRRLGFAAIAVVAGGCASVTGGNVERLTYGGSADDDPAWRDGVVGKSSF